MKGGLIWLAPKDQIHTIPEDTQMQQQTGGAHPRPRIETLADLSFGLSLSIGSIALIANPPKSTGEITTHILAFAYTFVVLVTAWMIYTTYMSVYPVEARTVI